MLVITLVVTFYILATQKMLDEKVALILLGFWLFFCLKSKETTVFISITILGFGFTKGDHFSWKQFIRSILWILVGFSIGIFVFMILSAIIVKDALWGLRISDWLNYLKITKNVRQVVIIPINWFIDGIAPMMLTPFILYILSGVKQHKDETQLHRNFFGFILCFF